MAALRRKREITHVPSPANSPMTPPANIPSTMFRGLFGRAGRKGDTA